MSAILDSLLLEDMENLDNIDMVDNTVGDYFDSDEGYKDTDVYEDIIEEEPEIDYDGIPADYLDDLYVDPLELEDPEYNSDNDIIDQVMLDEF